MSGGLANTQIAVKKYNVDVMENCNDSLYSLVNNLPTGKKLTDYVVSVDFTAYKKGEM